MKTNTSSILALLVVSSILTQACKKETLSPAISKSHTINTSGKTTPSKQQSNSGSTINRVKNNAINKAPNKSNTGAPSSINGKQTVAQVRTARAQKSQEREKLIKERDALGKTLILKKKLVEEKVARYENLTKLIEKQSIIVAAMERRVYAADNTSLIEARASLEDYKKQKREVSISGEALRINALGEADQFHILNAQIESIDDMDTNGYWEERYADAKEYEKQLAEQPKQTSSSNNSYLRQLLDTQPEQSKQTPSSNNYIGLLLEAAKTIE